MAEGAYIAADELLFYLEVTEGDTGTIFLPVACLTNNPLSETAEALQTTVRGNDGWRSYVPGIQDYRITINGVMDALGFSWSYLRDLKRARIVFNWKIGTEDGLINEQGSGFFTALTLDSEAGGLVTFSAEITPGVGNIVSTAVLVWSQNGLNIVTQNGRNGVTTI